jgi:hypothetical protein
MWLVRAFFLPWNTAGMSRLASDAVSRSAGLLPTRGVNISLGTEESPKEATLWLSQISFAPEATEVWLSLVSAERGESSEAIELWLAA